MTAAELVRIATAALFVVVFVAAAARAVRSPRRANVDTLLLVAAFSWVLVSSYVAAAAGLDGRAYATLNVALLLAIPLLTLRLVDDHVGVPRVALLAALAGWLGSVALIASGPEQIPPGTALAAVAYFALAQGYGAWRTVEASRRARGVTRRRLLSVAAGSAFIALAIVAAGGAILVPVLAVLPSPLALASAFAYFLGFMTPGALRRAWQAPEVLRFLGLASRLSQGAERDGALREVAAALAEVSGAEEAAVAIWDEQRDLLEVHPAVGEPFTLPAAGVLLGAALH
ncbi:MAG: hypothetical protein ACRDF0_03400, partial [Candidatus Limnocylindria bacterium]